MTSIANIRKNMTILGDQINLTQGLILQAATMTGPWLAVPVVHKVVHLSEYRELRVVVAVTHRVKVHHNIVLLHDGMQNVNEVGYGLSKKKKRGERHIERGRHQ